MERFEAGEGQQHLLNLNTSSLTDSSAKYTCTFDDNVTTLVTACIKPRSSDMNSRFFRVNKGNYDEKKPIEVA